MTATFHGLPCELCGAQNGCACPPCVCKWCRHSRGEPVSPLEQAAIDRQIESNRLYMERAANRASAARMRAKIDREISRITKKDKTQ